MPFHQNVSPLPIRPIDTRAIAQHTSRATGKPSAGTPGTQGASAPRGPNAELLVQHAGGSEVCFQIAVFDTSKRAVRFLVGTFLYPDTQATLVLRGSDAEEVWVRGDINDCEFVAGRVHSATMTLESPMDIGDLLPL